eukprot:g24746.t2
MRRLFRRGTLERRRARLFAAADPSLLTSSCFWANPVGRTINATPPEWPRWRAAAPGRRWSRDIHRSGDVDQLPLAFFRTKATFLQHEARQRSHHQAAAFGDGSTLALAARCKACLVWSLSISPLVQWCVCRRCIQGCGAFIMLKMTQVLETSTDERSKIWKPLCTMPDQAHLIGKKHIMADERGRPFDDVPAAYGCTLAPACQNIQDQMP